MASVSVLLFCSLASLASFSVTNVSGSKWDWSQLKHIWYKEQFKKIEQTCDSIPDYQRLDCFPDPGSNEQDCVDRGCCWLPATDNFNVPYCYYSGVYQQTGYQMGKATYVNKTYFYVDSTRREPSFMKGDIPTIRTAVSYETESRLRIKIYDPRHKRYEVPQKFVERPVDGQYSYSGTPAYIATVNEGNSYQIRVQRRAEGGATILKSIPDNFIVADQFLQMSFTESGSKLYGLGEHRGPLMYNTTAGKKVAIWARDQPLNTGCNEYGSHPMYMLYEDDGKAHGVVLMNSNAMDVTLQAGNIITWRTIGGILDYYVLLGPSPKDVVRQYLDLIGRPELPPYWALGFNLCRYGYGSSEETWKVVNRTRAIGFPQEVQWNDIDYMDAYMDFTYSSVNYSTLPQLVNDLHNNDQKYIMILDPGIFDGAPNSALEQGNKLKIWIKQNDGKTPLEGTVWPGTVHYPDFTNSRINEFWTGQMKSYHSKIPFDGVWIDMNEPSNFVDGSTTGCVGDTYDQPPFTPSICDGILTKTICMSAKQEAGIHYNLHNMYGHTEGIATKHGLETIFPDHRNVIISRSTFMSSGRYVGHWTGDNFATWDDLKYSITAVINTNLFGISFTGADVCGFLEDTTEELCTRWMQMGAFYTFFRNHNDISATDQDPAVFSSEAQQHMKYYALLRYQYLPYLYSELYTASTEGTTVSTALAFAFPEDENTHPIDTQFLWGSSIMVVPVLTQGATQVEAYFPKNTTWYALEQPSEVYYGGASYTISAPLSKLPLFVQSGSVIVSQKPEMTLTAARKNALTMEIFMPVEENEGYGHLFWDDGETVLGKKKFTYIKFHFHRIMGKQSGWVLQTEIVSDTHKDMPILDMVKVHGLETSVSVYVDQFTKESDKYREQSSGALVVEKLGIDLRKKLNIFFFFE
ncbi:lysosomal alpha-glucosidase-like [Convolutriloba macropyga]|uniref:lysosomal alpha-glucosidase-like n=1 Tax=Convolutriloba macropyga TaxID=536237 RepID=UPI003F51AD31